VPAEATTATTVVVALNMLAIDKRVRGAAAKWVPL